LIIHKLINEGNKLYLEFRFNDVSVDKCRGFRDKVGKHCFDYNGELPGWKFNIDLLPQVIELFHSVYVPDEVMDAYNKFIQKKKDDILKLF
jgi:hypothetical protein